MPEIAHAEVTCCVCGQLWDARDPGVAYRSYDRLWWCTDGKACLEWGSRAALLLAAEISTAPEDMTRMYQALDQAWTLLWDKMGWNT